MPLLEPNLQYELLPSINTKLELLRLGYGTLLRLLLHSGLYYGSYGAIMERVRGRKGALARAERDALSYMLSMGAEVGISVLIMPMRYLAAVTAPRFMLDYMLTGWSDKLSYLDLFRPGQFASFATYAFEDNRSSKWNFDFFLWQVPSTLLSLGKLALRWHRVGAERCRTKGVLLAMGVQLLLRAYVATFAVMMPENELEAVNAMLVTLMEGIATSYVVRHTWPFPLEEVIDSNGTTSSVDDTEHTTSEGHASHVTQTTDSSTGPREVEA